MWLSKDGVVVTKLLEHKGLNSAYGSMSNVWFLYYSDILAEAITLSGQLTVKWIGNIFNAYLNKVCGTVDKDRILAQDTDSVTGDSIIYVNGLRISIEEFFERVSNEFIKEDAFNDDYVKQVKNQYSLSVNKITGEIEEKLITYVMKHKVKKKMYRIKSNGNSVIVTENHSIIVKNKITGKISSIKPAKLNSDIHFVINIIGNDTDCKVTNENNKIFE